MQKTGRPTKFNRALADEISRRLAEGEPYVKICADHHMPNFSTLWRWERNHAEFRDQTRMALQHGTHFLAHDCLRIADDPEIDARHKRVMIDTRLRLIGKWNAKSYGDKINQQVEIEPGDEIRKLLAEISGSAQILDDARKRSQFGGSLSETKVNSRRSV